jgi:hypothetical protein
MARQADYNTAYTFYLPLIDPDDPNRHATSNPALAAGDVTVSKDNGTAANIATLPVYSAITGVLKVDLSATEMQAQDIIVRFNDQTDPETFVSDFVHIETINNASAKFPLLQAEDVSDRPVRNEALNDIPFYMVDSTDHTTPETGLSVTAERSLDGAAFASVSGTVNEISDGVYSFDASAADMDGDIVILKFTATGADPQLITIKTRT